MTGSAVPDALAALTALWAGLNIATLQVGDGPIYDPEIDFLAVGWDRSEQPSVIAQAANNDAGAMSTAEQFDVSCLLSMWAGNSDVPTIRDAIFDVFAALKAALAADRQLGGLVDSTWITTYDYTPDAGEAGDQVDLRFTVHVGAFFT